ncbi:hypothetical protein J2S62_002611 [Enteractinococcus fodinae]|uniref:Uncharacterized protein n=1 Tax=Enteractinococcus fodinae TaxID=684663 RepID=A0ABU2B7I7_9MICC|nr:hypothetical protein [Enteractinococcus fodinae]
MPRDLLNVSGLEQLQLLFDEGLLEPRHREHTGRNDR